jgi:uncharacterized protein YndB with AHSA1/START domain
VKITVETDVNADLDSVWHAWNDPEAVKQWNAACASGRLRQLGGGGLRRPLHR